MDSVIFMVFNQLIDQMIFDKVIFDEVIFDEVIFDKVMSERTPVYTFDDAAVIKFI